MTLEDLDAMFSDTNDPWFNPQATFSCDTVEAQRLLDWGDDNEDISEDLHDELLLHLNVDDECSFLD